MKIRQISHPFLLRSPCEAEILVQLTWFKEAVQAKRVRAAQRRGRRRLQTLLSCGQLTFGSAYQHKCTGCVMCRTLVRRCVGQAVCLEKLHRLGQCRFFCSAVQGFHLRAHAETAPSLKLQSEAHKRPFFHVRAQSCGKHRRSAALSPSVLALIASSLA